MPNLASARSARIGFNKSGPKCRWNNGEGSERRGTPNPLVNGAQEPLISATLGGIIIAAKQRRHTGFHNRTVRRSCTLLRQMRGSGVCTVPRSGIADMPVHRPILPGAR